MTARARGAQAADRSRSARTMRRSIGRTPGRRTRSIRRASAGLSPVRAGAILAMLVAAVSVYGVAQAAAFQVVDIQVEGASFTDPAAIVAAVEPAKGTNIFALAHRPLEDARCASLPTVRGADVSVGLPGTLVVRIRERRPILVWRIGARRYLADSDGPAVRELPDDPRPAPPRSR